MSLIVFASVSGGSGCSTAAAHCAQLMQNAGYPTLAIDICDNNGLSLALGIDSFPETGWAKFEKKTEILNNAILEAPSGLKLIPCGFGKSAKLKDASILFNEILNKQAFQCIVDAGNIFSNYFNSISNKTDLLILSARAEYTSFLQLEHAIEKIISYNIPFRVLVGRYDVRRASQIEILKKILKKWPDYVFLDIVHEDEQLADSFNFGVSVHEIYPQAQSAHDLIGIFHNICKILNDGR